jgi:hypothetical protein
MAQAVPQARSRKEQIPPDLVVKLKSLILLKLFYDHSDAQMWVVYLNPADNSIGPKTR